MDAPTITDKKPNKVSNKKAELSSPTPDKDDKDDAVTPVMDKKNGEDSKQEKSLLNKIPHLGFHKPGPSLRAITNKYPSPRDDNEADPDENHLPPDKKYSRFNINFPHPKFGTKSSLSEAEVFTDRKPHPKFGTMSSLSDAEGSTDMKPDRKAGAKMSSETEGSTDKKPDSKAGAKMSSEAKGSTDKKASHRFSLLHPFQGDTKREPSPEPKSWFDRSVTPPPSPAQRFVEFLKDHMNFGKKEEEEEEAPPPRRMRADSLWECYRCGTWCLKQQQVCPNCEWNPRC